MTIESDIVTALSSVASGRVYPNAAPQDAAVPFVVYRLVDADPVNTLRGYAGATKSTFAFESWAATKSSAVTIRAAVQTAIDAVYATLAGFREPPGESGYDPETDQYMEPCVYSFWHS